MSEGAAPIALWTRGLDVRYGRVHAVRDASLRIRANSVTALIGASGCGKTSFLRALNRLHDATPEARVSGEVYVEGTEIYGPGVDPAEVRRRVGMIFPRPAPFATSIFENVAYGARVHGVRGRRRLETVVERSLRGATLWEEVKDRLHEPAHALAGGQRQLLCVARALAVAPRVLLMDEPASALDPIATARVEDLISSLKRTHTVVIVTHSMQQAARVSDETAFFHMGEIVETGSTAELFMRPRHRKTEDYITGRTG